MEVAAGKLDHKAVTIIFFERTDQGVQLTNIFLSDKGAIVNPPDSYRAFFLEEQQRLLGL